MNAWIAKILLFVLSIILICFTIERRSSTPISVVEYTNLPGWSATALIPSLITFRKSCTVLLHASQQNTFAIGKLQWTSTDWWPVCHAAKRLQLSKLTEAQVQRFFQHWLQPYKIQQKDQKPGLFTGYYSPVFQGSLKPTKQYSVPIFAYPDNLIRLDAGIFDSALKDKHWWGQVVAGKFVPYASRYAIRHGALDTHAQVLVWLKSHIDRLFLEIQGSGTIQLSDKTELGLGYAGQNGLPYTPIGRVLVSKGLMSKQQVSMQNIRAYLQHHPHDMLRIIDKNRSFVFFKIVPRSMALGAQGINLTPGYSLAVDPHWVPLGVPIWLNTQYTDQHGKLQSLQRLMVAQDTGGAIKGIVRGDIYWGRSKRAAVIAGHMQSHGTYWLLLPHVLSRKLHS